MPQWSRRKFLYQLSLAGMSIATAAVSFKGWALPAKRFTLKRFSPAEPSCCNAQPFIVDIHCHPNLKVYLLDKHMWRHFLRPHKKGTNRYSLQADFHNLSKGNVRGFLAAHHLPEKGMVTQANANRKLAPFIRTVLPLLAEKVENGDESNYAQLTYMMDEFEEHIRKTNEKKGGRSIKIAKSFTEFEAILSDDKQIAVAQSIEGIHALGRRISLSEYMERLNFLADRGICSITLSHFFPNDMSYPVEGIEPHEKRKISLNWNYDARYDNRPLTPVGKVVVKEMLRRGVIVDLTHMTPQGRADVFEVHKQFHEETGILRPLVFSHTGIRKVFDKYKPELIPPGKKNVSSYKYITPDEAEIKYIHDSGGVIGIIGENFWLAGNDNHTSYTKTKDFENGIPLIIETIKTIYEITGDYSSISLGSDFDGFANAPTDFRNPKYFKTLLVAIKKEIPDCDVNAITHCNALRVLKNGWGPA